MSEVLKQLQAYSRINQSKVLAESVEANKDAIVDLNRDQLRRGQKGDGDMVGYRSSAYLNYKRSLSSYFAGNKTDLYLTGDFQKGMNGKIFGTEFEIGSTDSKTSEILEKYGEQIFELNQEFKPQAVEFVSNTYLKKINDLLHNR